MKKVDAEIIPNTSLLQVNMLMKKGSRTKMIGIAYIIGYILMWTTSPYQNAACKKRSVIWTVSIETVPFIKHIKIQRIMEQTIGSQLPRVPMVKIFSGTPRNFKILWIRNPTRRSAVCMIHQDLIIIDN
ncbi:adenine nucleotide alpha hydrolases-likesuperfamily protein, partial [Striga asiatica]